MLRKIYIHGDDVQTIRELRRHKYGMIESMEKALKKKPLEFFKNTYVMYQSFFSIWDKLISIAHPALYRYLKYVAEYNEGENVFKLSVYEHPRTPAKYEPIIGAFVESFPMWFLTIVDRFEESME